VQNATSSSTNEPLRGGRERKRTCKGHAAPEHDGAAEAGIAEDAEDRLQDGTREERNAQQHADLRVRERQLLANERPGRVAGAPGELVQQLDC
jgi:hypothetical protein